LLGIVEAQPFPLHKISTDWDRTLMVLAGEVVEADPAAHQLIFVVGFALGMKRLARLSDE
jgi:uncharacterized membrane protein (Fun14 family)